MDLPLPMLPMSEARTVEQAGSLMIIVHGRAAPQGSKRGFVNKHTGRVQVVESSARVAPWREAVKEAALIARGATDGDLCPTLTGPVRVVIRFVLARPKGHYGTGRNGAIVKASAPAHPTVKPDLDKLARSTLDALQEASVYRDDSLIVSLIVTKAYPGDGIEQGAVINVSPL